MSHHSFASDSAPRKLTHYPSPRRLEKRWKLWETAWGVIPRVREISFTTIENDGQQSAFGHSERILGRSLGGRDGCHAEESQMLAEPPFIGDACHMLP